MATATLTKTPRARKQSFAQFVHTSVATLLPTPADEHPTARDSTKANSWDRLVHCSTALGYAFVLNGSLVGVALAFSSLAWTRRDAAGNLWLSSESLVFAFSITMGGSLFGLYFYVCSKATKTANCRGGSRYARFTLFVTLPVWASIVSGICWALQSHLWYNLLIPPIYLMWAIFMVVFDILGRKRWSARHRRSQGGQHKIVQLHHEVGGEPGGAGAGGSISAHPAMPVAEVESSAKLFVKLIGLIATFFVFSLCKWIVDPAQKDYIIPLSNMHPPLCALYIKFSFCKTNPESLRSPCMRKKQNRSSVCDSTVLHKRHVDAHWYLYFPAPCFTRSRRSTWSRHKMRSYRE